MLSFWERKEWVRADYIVIGSGLVGLTTALSIKKNEPTAQVVVLERGILPSGASTKNAGFACFGSLTEILSDLQKMSPNECFSIVEQRWKGLQSLRNLLGDTHMDFQNLGGYELIREDKEECLNDIDRINEWLMPLFDKPVYQVQDQKIQSFGFSRKAFKHMIFNPFEGQIDTGKTMLRLQQLAQEAGVRIHTGCEVRHFDEREKEVAVWVGSAWGDICFTASKVAICTNGFSQILIPELEVKPGRGQVLITEPIPNLAFKGTFHVDEGYFYFRNFENRILFGGGRNTEIENETTTRLQTTESIRALLRKILFEEIIPDYTPQIAQYWAGIMAFGPDKKPIVKKHSERIVLGVRMNGMGVAIGAEIGHKTAQLLLES